MGQCKRINSIRVRIETDENPDISWLGKYTDRWENGAIDRKARGDWSRGEYQYFVPGNSLEDHRRGLSKMGYSKHDAYTMARGYTIADYRRMESLSNGDWHFVGIWAEGEVVIGNTIQRIRSGGLWGIESDSGKYLEEVAQQELSEIADQLRQLSFGKRTVSQAIAGAKPIDF